MNTKLVEGVYKNNPYWAIHRVTSEGKIEFDIPIISMGKRKTETILKHIEDIKKWADKQEE